ncbi:Hypothetical protein NTJ_10371 [Nesidiocoris tenuis]|uniref:Uncharacterized protein n=1 Tax=Nesidiocoris tenuis TaxID=355587 RepID=A0ABN7AZH2_9HEMI|nr:Hypothetical protein NTJ_10371 [Nesidiocoris tenuis]
MGDDRFTRSPTGRGPQGADGGGGSLPTTGTSVSPRLPPSTCPVHVVFIPADKSRRDVFDSNFRLMNNFHAKNVRIFSIKIVYLRDLSVFIKIVECLSVLDNKSRP